MENGLSASDVALMSRNNDGGFGFGGDGAWIFGLLVLLGLFNGGFGGFGGNRGDRNATVGDVQRATDFAALERQNNEGVAATRQSAYDVMTAIKDGNFNVLGELRDIQSGVNAGFANQLRTGGIYHVSADVTLTATAAGTATVQIALNTVHVETDISAPCCPAAGGRTVTITAGGVAGTVTHVCSGVTRLA